MRLSTELAQSISNSFSTKADLESEGKLPFFLKLVLKGSVDESSLPLVFRKFSQNINDAALSAALSKMASAILADGRIDECEAAQLSELLKGMEGQSEFRKALDDARADGVITLDESAVLDRFLRKAIGRKA